MGQVVLGEWMTLGMMSLALGLDSFSVSLGLGMRSMRLYYIAKISLVNALFHMLMPLLGIILGRYLSDVIGHVAVYAGGSILIFFGIHMVYSSLFGEEVQTRTSLTGLGLLFFSFGVSVDSFSVGLSLGLFAVNTLLTIIFFGISALILTATGLVLGNKMGGWIGHYGEAAGGMILVIFGMHFLL